MLNLFFCLVIVTDTRRENMRIHLVIKDNEYSKAMAEVIAQMGKDVFVEIGISDLESLDNESIIITDSDYKDIKQEDYANIIFLTNNKEDKLLEDNSGKPIKIFKYNSMNSILADIEHIHYLLSGKSETTNGVLSRVYAVCTDNHEHTNSLCQALARQIMFRHGGNMIIISMDYLNNYPSQYEKDRSKFSRWMYYLDIGRDYSIEEFTTSDSYGISYLRLPSGLNPLAYLKLSEIEDIIDELCNKKFETVILDISNCYSEPNVRLINKADNILYFQNDESSFDVKSILVDPSMEERVEIVSMNDKPKEIELVLDEYIRRIYGDTEGETGNEQENNS